MRLPRAFRDHPESVGETYAEHFVTAAGFAVRMAAGALACAVHAVLPFAFVRTGSSIISELHQRMVAARARGAAAAGVAGAADERAAGGVGTARVATDAVAAGSSAATRPR